MDERHAVLVVEYYERISWKADTGRVHSQRGWKVAFAGIGDDDTRPDKDRLFATRAEALREGLAWLTRDDDT